MFNLNNLVFLGIFAIIASVVVIYFEHKIREQNHKMTSMLSLVSTLADDLTGVKMGLNHVMVLQGGGNTLPVSIPQHSTTQPSSMVDSYSSAKMLDNKKFIHVSDDENDSEIDDESDSESDDENDDESDSCEDSEEEDCEEDADENTSNIQLEINQPNYNDEECCKEDVVENSSVEKIKIVKLSMNEMDTDMDDEIEELNEDETINGLSDDNDEHSELKPEYVKQVLDLKYEETLGENPKETTSEGAVKKNEIGVHEEIEKMPVAQLRELVVDKGMVSKSDATKLKKQDILKMFKQ
jgi:hypothetical protein